MITSTEATIIKAKETTLIEARIPTDSNLAECMFFGDVTAHRQLTDMCITMKSETLPLSEAQI
jgi:hypothetical protein